MAKKPNISTVASGYQGTATINNNFQNIRDQFDNTLSRDGSTPNAMLADLDMNGYSIINVGATLGGGILTVDAADARYVNTTGDTMTGSLISPALYTNGLYINGNPVTPSTLVYNGVVKETKVATSGQTVFNLSLISYTPGINNLSVYVDGIYQKPSNYTENSSTQVTFSVGLHVGAIVDFVVLSIGTLSGTADATNLTYTTTGSGAQSRTIKTKLDDVVSVKDFGAVGDGVADDYAAFAAAIAAANFIYVPPGEYKIGTQISITGNKTISGPDGNNYESQPARINFTAATGNCFSATSAEFGGITIRNLSIVGGNGSYAIRSSRPQSTFENLKLETYTGGGIQLFEAGTASQASWCTAIRNVKWVGPSTQTNYYGFDITQNGGQLIIDRCNAVNGTIGLNINQGEAITVTGCVFNQQNSVRSSAAATDQCGIRLSGAGYKKAIRIAGNYIEACTYAVYVDKCESLTIEDNYIADVGYNAGYSSLYLQSAVSAIVNNVTIRNNVFQDQGANSASIDIGDYAKNVLIENNYLRLTGASSIGIRKGTQYFSWIRNNDIQVNAFTGITLSDPNRLLVNMDYQQEGFTNGKYQNFLALPNTWYNVAPADRDQIWILYIARANDPATWRRRDDLFISSSSTTTFVNTYDVNPGYDTPEWRLSGGMIQFRIVGTNNSLQNVSAVRIA